jgi:hypothetical protein
LEKADGAVCFEVPFEGLPVTNITSESPLAPRSYSSLLFTPGLRFESDDIFGGFLPFNVVGIGLGPARYLSSRGLISGATAEQERTTTWVLRAEIGGQIPLPNHLGLRMGIVGDIGGLPAWFRDTGSVLPQGEHLGSSRVGGFGALYFRR